MRMKKLFFFAAIAAMAVSCAKTNEVNPVSERAIGFDTWTSNLTKSTHTPFSTGATFDVYGYKYKTEGNVTTPVFEGDDVTLAANGSWNYTTLRFWDRTTNSYTFFAISPAGITSSASATTGLMTTNNVTFGGKNGDVLVAKKKEVVKSNYGLTVDLDFVPQAALFDLKFKKAKNLKEAELTVNSVTLRNIANKGSLAITDYDGTSTPVGAWTIAPQDLEADPAVTSYANFNNTHGITSVTLPVSIAAGVEHGTDNSEFLINHLIVMPQTLITSGQQLDINYTVTFSGEAMTHSRTIDLNTFDLTDMAGEGREESDQNTTPFVTKWDCGKHYTYYLTINADMIVFNATISDWTDVNAFHYIIN